MERKKNEGSGNCEEGKSADCRAKRYCYRRYVDLHLRSSSLLSGLLGTVVAVMNFLLMGITVQGVLSVENQEEAYQRMRLSYRKRTMLQLGWIILAIVAPCFQAVPGIIPLLFPGAFLRIRGIVEWRKGKNQKQGGEN